MNGTRDQCFGARIGGGSCPGLPLYQVSADRGVATPIYSCGHHLTGAVNRTGIRALVITL